MPTAIRRRSAHYELCIEPSKVSRTKLLDAPRVEPGVNGEAAAEYRARSAPGGDAHPARTRRCGVPRVTADAAGAR
jgi:hypothetical protein